MDLATLRLEATGQTTRPSRDALLNSARQPDVNDLGGPACHRRPGLGDVSTVWGRPSSGGLPGSFARISEAAITQWPSRCGILSSNRRLG